MTNDRKTANLLVHLALYCADPTRGNDLAAALSVLREARRKFGVCTPAEEIAFRQVQSTILQWQGRVDVASRCLDKTTRRAIRSRSANELLRPLRLQRQVVQQDIDRQPPQLTSVSA